MRLMVKSRLRGVSALAFTAFLLLFCFPIAASAAVSGEIVQKPGVAGCLSLDGSGGNCTQVDDIDGVLTVWTSPDGRNAYALTGNNGAIVSFSRDVESGELTRLSGADGCMTESGNGGACATGRFLTGMTLFTFTDDGRMVYGVSQADKAVIIFDRDPGTGALTQRSGVSGCYQDTGGGGQCTDAVAFDLPILIVLDDSETHAYLSTGSGIAVFDRDPQTGVLTQKSGTDGCVTSTGNGGLCRIGTAVYGTKSIGLSPDGRNVYGTASDSNSIVVFDVDPETGEIAQKAGTDGCVSVDGTGGACSQGIALTYTNSGVVSSDGMRYYVLLCDILLAVNGL